MHRFKRSLAILVVGLGLVNLPAALAANPVIDHFGFSDTVTDTDFCGTGATIEIFESLHGTAFLDPNQPGIDFRFTFEGRFVFTNPLSGKTVVNNFAGAHLETLSGDEEGLHTVTVTERGLRGQLYTTQGGLLTRDAGDVVFELTFDGDEFISQEIILVRGPHPILEDEVDFCELMTSALGLS
jgi:hypothetical protein